MPASAACGSIRHVFWGLRFVEFRHAMAGAFAPRSGAAFAAGLEWA